MNPSLSLSRTDRIRGGLWGAVIGDALGVPVEFEDRASVQANPVSGMRGFGSHNQAPGTWSDDSSLLLCSADSLLRNEFDLEDMGKRFLAWYREELWTPHGRVFDIGVTTSQAVSRISQGVGPELAGSDSQYSNGNGSLMRMLPVSLRFSPAPTIQLLDRVHRASAITHRHLRSQMACGFYSLVIRQLLRGAEPGKAIAEAVREFRSFYEGDSSWAVQLDYFRLLLEGDLGVRRESEIDSTGYVVHTLTASLWCLLTTSSFEECVLKAVNLGGDTDTTGCVAGGLAGVAYGIRSIPEDWIGQLAREEDLDYLFDEFASLCSKKDLPQQAGSEGHEFQPSSE